MLSCLIMPIPKKPASVSRHQEAWFTCTIQTLAGGLKCGPDRRPIWKRHTCHMSFAVICGPCRVPFSPFRVGNPVPSLPFPTKTRPCPLTMIFYAPRWSFSILPVIALSTLATPLTRPCKPHLKSTT
jgi:hypothetical protein